MPSNSLHTVGLGAGVMSSVKGKVGQSPSGSKAGIASEAERNLTREYECTSNPTFRPSPLSKSSKGMCACVNSQPCVCLRAYLHVCVCVCVYICVRVCIITYILGRMRVNVTSKVRKQMEEYCPKVGDSK